MARLGLGVRVRVVRIEVATHLFALGKEGVIVATACRPWDWQVQLEMPWPGGNFRKDNLWSFFSADLAPIEDPKFRALMARIMKLDPVAPPLPINVEELK